MDCPTALWRTLALAVTSPVEHTSLEDGGLFRIAHFFAIIVRRPCPKNKSETRVKAINMEPQPPLRGPESENWKFFLKIPELDRPKIKLTTFRQQQVQEPIFDLSDACSGCGETPYLKLVSQLLVTGR